MPRHDLVVIGAGPGGYTAAIRAAQLGLDVGCVDREERLGGTCLRVGCIPSKAMLESSELYHQVSSQLARHGISASGVELDLGKMLTRKDQVVKMLTQGIAGLFKKNGVTRYQGSARFEAPGRVVVEGEGEPQTLEAERVLVATGSSPVELPFLRYDGERVGSSTDALAYDAVPGRLVVIGAGYIGLELGSVWNRLGSKVTVLEALDRILPGMDADIANEAHKIFEKQGLEFRLGCRVSGAEEVAGGLRVKVEEGEPIECDRVLVAVGRRPHTAGLGLDAIGLELDEHGRIPVDDRFATSVDGVFAIGDVIAGPMLAHKAEEDGVACVEGLVTGHGHVDYALVPGVVYTHPEIATVGKSEEQLAEAGIEYRKGEFPFRANARARTLNDVDGKVKVLADAKTDRILGVHIIGPRAGELIAEAAAAMAFGASSEDLARTCHAHPTLPEALKEAALAVDGRAINF